MGTYNSILIDVFDPDIGQWSVKDYGQHLPFSYQDYSISAFIADIRNYSKVPSIAPNRFLPLDHNLEEPASNPSWRGHNDFEDNSRYCGFLEEGASYSWVFLQELIDFDYDQTFENRRATGPGYNTVKEGRGQTITFREYLGDRYFEELGLLNDYGAGDQVRLVWKFS